MKKKLALILFVCMLFTTVMGCWSRVETENLAIVTMIAVDRIEIKGESKYRVAVKVVRTGQLGLGQQGGGGIQRSPTWVDSNWGDTPQEALNKMTSRSPREIFLAHSKFIVIGEKLAAQGIQETLDLLLRHRDIRLRNWVVVTKGEAEDILEAEPELEQLLHEEIGGLIEQTKPLGNRAVSLDLKDFAAQMATPGRDIAVSKLELHPPPEKINQADIKKAFGVEPADASPAGKAVFLTGSAIFREDKLVGYLGDWETGGLLQILGEAKEGVVPIRVDEGGFLSYVMTRSEKEIKSKVVDGEYIFDVKINMEGDLGEHSHPHEITVEQVSMHEKEISKAITKQIDAAIKAAQKDFRADIFGLGEVLRRQHNSEWKKVKENWREVFPDVKVNVSVDAKIRRQGMVSDTLMVE